MYIHTRHCTTICCGLCYFQQDSVAAGSLGLLPQDRITKEFHSSRVQKYTPIILAIWEVEFMRIKAQSHMSK
jgi:hypothetical protein